MGVEIVGDLTLKAGASSINTNVLGHHPWLMIIKMLGLVSQLRPTNLQIKYWNGPKYAQA